MSGSLASALRRCVLSLALSSSCLFAIFEPMWLCLFFLCGTAPADFCICGDFGDFGVSFVSTVAGRCTRWGGPRLSVQGEPLMVLTRGP